MAGKKEEELSGPADRACRRQRVGRYHSRCTQTLAPEALQQWCSKQHKNRMELQKLQRRIQRTLDHIRDPSRELPPHTPTAVLEQLQAVSGHQSWAEALAIFHQLL